MNYGALVPEETERDPVTGQPVPNGALANLPRTSSSAPPSSGAMTQTQQATPPRADEGALPQGGGAGSVEPPDMMKDRGSPKNKVRDLFITDPSKGADLMSTVAQRVEAAGKDEVSAAQARKMTQTMKAQGADPVAAAAQLVETANDGIDLAVKDKTITQKVGDRLKKNLNNFYNIVPEDQMGLFLIDFGLRAMMAGENMGTMAALGSAGLGALQGVQGRQQAEKESALEQQRYEREFALKERGVAADEMTAEARMKAAERETGSTRPMQVQLAVEALIAAGYTKVEAGQIVHGGGMSRERAIVAAEEAWNKSLDDGRSKFVSAREWRSMDESQKQQYEQNWKDSFIARVAVSKTGTPPLSAGKSAGGGALAKPSELSVEERAEAAMRKAGQ